MLASLASILIISWQSAHEILNMREGDSGAYMPLAKELVDRGVYTDGRYSEHSVAHGPENQGMFFAPLYPALLAGIMALDHDLYERVACHTSQTHGDYERCGHDFGLLLPVHILLASISVFLIWLTGWVLTGRYRVAWIGLALGCMAQAYAYYTAMIMTENLIFPLFTATTLCAAAAWKKKSARVWLLCGIFLGLSALTRPAFVYILYVGLPALILFTLWNKNLTPRQKFSWPLLLLAGYALTAGPWILRNGLTMNQYAISKGYDVFILTQRISFNDMNWKEFGVSFIHGLPGFGDSLAEYLFKPEDYERFDYDNPGGFYGVRIAVRDRTLHEAGSVPNHLSYVIKHEIGGNLFKHVMVTFSMAWRGMWISKAWGLVAIPLFAIACILALRRRWTEFFIFAIPPWFMLGFHAFTSVNVTRYNLILIPCLSLAVAVLLDLGIRHIQERKVKQETS
jgi:4-amino-4-deoxy-L-arabinose transferase-like glycosyltransferase